MSVTADSGVRKQDGSEVLGNVVTTLWGGIWLSILLNRSGRKYQKCKQAFHQELANYFFSFQLWEKPPQFLPIDEKYDGRQKH